jgi:hypothetical protein
MSDAFQRIGCQPIGQLMGVENSRSAGHIVLLDMPPTPVPFL